MEQMRDKEANFVSAVVYLHNRETNVTPFFEMLYRVLENNFKKYEIICVNDDASEIVLEQVRAFKKRNKSVTLSIINMGFRQGIEASMNAGIDLAIGDYVFEFDSTYVDYNEALIMEIYNRCMTGYDIVSARVPKAEMNVFSKMFYWLYNRYSGTSYKLSTERLCIISRRAINRVSAYSKTIPYRKAVYAASGLNLTSIDYEPIKTDHVKKQNDMGRIDTASDALVLFTDLAYRVSLFFSMLMAIVMFGFGIYTVIVYFGAEKPVAGWSPLMGLISLGFLSLFILMTFLFKYLQVIVRLVFKRQKYMVSSIEKL